MFVMPALRGHQLNDGGGGKCESKCAEVDESRALIIPAAKVGIFLYSGATLFFILQQLFEQWTIPSDIFQLHDGRDLVARIL